MAFLYVANRIAQAVVSNDHFVPVEPGLSVQFAVGLCCRLAWDSFWLRIDAKHTVDTLGIAVTVAGLVAGFACAPKGPAGAGGVGIVLFGVAGLVGLVVRVVSSVALWVAVYRVATTLYRGELHCLQV